MSSYFADLVTLVGASSGNFACDLDDTLTTSNEYWVGELLKLQPHTTSMTARQIVAKYGSVNSYPHWPNHEAAKSWVDTQLATPAGILSIPVVQLKPEHRDWISRNVRMYLTARSDSVKEPTEQWLLSNGLPSRPVICYPDSIAIPDKEPIRDKWKADVLTHLWPRVVGTIDDNINVLNHLQPDYAGKFMLFGNSNCELRQDINAVRCPNWDYVLKN